MSIPKALRDYTGMRIGRVTVVSREVAPRVHVVRTGEEYTPPQQWLCRCQCGTEWLVPHARISNTSPASCKGCANHKHHLKLPKSHLYNKRQHPSYGSWYAMIRRCTAHHYKSYHDYGGRGITVHPPWMDFDQFVKDMGTRPPGHSIDRKDNSLGYTPSNCRWATPAQQANNKRPYKRRA